MPRFAWYLVVPALAGSAALLRPHDSMASELSLRDSYATLGERLANNQFDRPMVLDSAESAEHLTGHLYAVVKHPFDRVRTALHDPQHWCDVLSLHSNNKYCRVNGAERNVSLLMFMGSKTAQPLGAAMRVDMGFAVVHDTPQFLQVELRATRGPLGTSDYRVALEAIPLTEGSSFLHMTYSTATNVLARVAMQGYLATAGRGKVGFTSTRGVPQGPPVYVGGALGAIERNSMRYYLAVDAYLGSTQAPQAEQLETRLQSWYGAVERYPVQLHEMEREPYLQMKRAEHIRQQSPP